MNSATLKTVPQIRVFLASPGDVNEERAVTLEVLDTLEYDLLFKQLGGVSIHAIAWDKKGSSTAMRATMTPQTAIKEGLPRPSECDIALVLFWGRMGTELPYPEYQKADGSKYRSGTEWEFNDALEAERATGKPITLIYRRTEEPNIDTKDRKQVAQYHAVLDFFDQFSDSETGALKGGVNEYATPEDLRQTLLVQLRQILYNILTAEGYSATGDKPTHRPQVEAAPLWAGSPFPGLRAFTAKDAPIFFGRGAETSELVKRIENSRFTAVVAASGSGKSSLVAAGLIPRLKANAIVSGETGSKDWRFVRFTPGQSENPFAALFAALCETFPEHPVSPFLIEQEKEGFISSIRKNPAALINVCDGLLREAKAPEWAEVLFFVDQFEELFTGIPDERAAERLDFIALLAAIQASRRLRCVVTMRSDFTAKAIDDPTLAGLMNQGNYLLSAPTAGALLEMIKRPAERAGLTWDDGLPEQMQADTGTESGALALLAYALDELYHAAGDAKCLTRSAYTALGGVEGAIGRRAENTFAALALADKELVLGRVFRELVTVDERGTATRQRADQGHFDNAAGQLVQAFVQARLLVTDGGTVEVAHEALFRSWERLKGWIAGAQEDLILLRQVRSAAQEWDKNGRPDFLLWPQERLVLVYAMRERLKPDLNAVEEAFIEPEQARLLREIEILTTDHKRRRWIGERLATINDPRSGIGVDTRGLPQMNWLPVTPGGTIEIKGKSFTVQPFYVAQYLTTYRQFQAFLDAPDGFENEQWWEGMPDGHKRQAMSSAVAQYENYPRDSVTWYQAVVFGRWLDAKYRQFGLFEPFEALTPNPSPRGEGLKNPEHDIDASTDSTSPRSEGLKDVDHNNHARADKDYRAMAAKVMVEIARDLRQRSTSAEELLWECVRDRRLNNLKFRRQHPVANTAFVVDFFCNEAQLAIEVDGGIHESQQREDHWREQALKDAGMTVIRFTNEDIFNDLERVLIQIQTAATSPLAQPPLRGWARGTGGEGWQIRLPTEWEWQWAAQGGAEGREYPWGKWQDGYANTTEAGIGDRSTAVGMYPQGTAVCGAVDVAGNLWEWCQNDYEKPEVLDGYSNAESKVLRGGSFYIGQSLAAARCRANHDPRSRYGYSGFRLVLGRPL